MFILSVILCLLGFLSFSLANSKHFSAVFENREFTAYSQWGFHILGWIMLVIAADILTTLWSLEIGLTIWVGLLQLTSVIVALLFTYSLPVYTFCSKYLLPSVLITKKEI